MGHTEDQVAAVLAGWAAAELAGDAAGIGSRLTDDFLAVGPLGFLLSKQEWLDRHAAGALTYDAFAVEQPQIRVYGGDAVVVVGRQTQRGAYQGHPVPTDTRASFVLVRDSGTWRIAGIHMSFIAGTPGAPPIPGQSPGQAPAGRAGAPA